MGLLSLKKNSAGCYHIEIKITYYATPYCVICYDINVKINTNVKNIVPKTIKETTYSCLRLTHATSRGDNLAVKSARFCIYSIFLNRIVYHVFATTIYPLLCKKLYNSEFINSIKFLFLSKKVKSSTKMCLGEYFS